MNKKKLFAFFIFFFISTIVIYGQQPKNIRFVDSQQMLDEAVILFDQGYSEKSISILLDIPIGDSLYAQSRYYAAFFLIKMKKYDDAEKIIDEILSNPYYHKHISYGYMLLYKGYACFNKQEYKNAIACYEQALKYLPYNYLVHYNLGEVYDALHDYTRAEMAYKRAIFCSPLNDDSHYKLGVCFLNQCKTIPALLALNCCVLMNNKGKFSFEALQLLNELYSSGSEDYYENHDIEQVDDSINSCNKQKYKYVDNLLKSHFALSSKYKEKTDILHIITLQNQILFENLPESEDIHSVVDNFYFPLFKRIVEDKKNYNAFSYLQLANTDVLYKKKNIQNIVDKSLAIVQKVSSPLMEELMGNGIELGEQEKSYHCFEYTDGALVSFGEERVKSKKRNLYNGKWTLLNDRGAVNYVCKVKNGLKNGEALSYESEEFLAKYNMVNNSFEGPAYYYYMPIYIKQKQIQGEINFKNSEINGSRKLYNRSGYLVEKSTFLDDLFEGWVVTYNSDGTLNDSSFYDGGVIQYGQSYYNNGNLKSVISFTNDGKQQLFDYYYNGKIQSSRTFFENRHIGIYNEYFSNGNLKLTQNFNSAGKAEGLFIQYYDDETVYLEVFYKDGKCEGPINIYDCSGFKRITKKCINDSIVEILTYNPDGSVRETVKAENGFFSVDVYNAYGLKTIHFSCTPSDQYIGDFLCYNSLGKVMLKKQYNKLNGKLEKWESFNDNGTLRYYSNFSEGSQNGLELVYNSNGVLVQESNYNEDELDGASYTYTPNGDLESLSLYDKNELYLQKTYYPNGNLQSELNFLEGNPYIMTIYDTLGSVWKMDTLFNDDVYKRYYLNGNVMVEGKCIEGKCYGKCKIFDIDGKLLTTSTVFQGVIMDTLKSFYPSGKISNITPCLGGEPDGLSTSYFENGNIKRVEAYQNGALSGDSKFYTEDGKLSYVIHYNDDSREGFATYYSPEGEIAYTLKYSDGNIVGYSYVTQSGLMSDFYLFTQDSIVIEPYYTNGQKSMNIVFNNGVRDGKHISYYKNGNISEIEEYDNSMLCKLTCYYPSGIMKNYCEFKDSYYHGKELSYYPSGQLCFEKKYYFDSLHGPVNYFNEQGKIIKNCLFFYGEQIK